MGGPLIWDETKRQANLAKHGLDFRAVRIVSFRYASEPESEKYYEWIEKDAPPNA